MATTTTTSTNSLKFVTGNTYQRIPDHQAPWDRNHVHRKTLDWTLFVDVIAGDANLLEKVSFDLGTSFVPSVFHCCSPVLITNNNNIGQSVWRFATRQQSYGTVTATIQMRGLGGTLLTTSHTIQRQYNQSGTMVFHEPQTLRPLRMVKMVDTACFGIELELSSANSIVPESVANQLRRRVEVVVIDNYSQGRATHTDWKIVPDSSIVCSASSPDCNKFELVSPKLQGGRGLSVVSSVLRQLGELSPALSVNKSMGFHVHVDVSGFSHYQLIKICQQFIKYEDVIDSFMPPSRRTNSPESRQFFQSNKHVSLHGCDTNRQRHTALEHCLDIYSLAAAMNRNGDRYYKLNLQNLVSGRQPTIEFRQHSATMVYDKVSPWVRFCVAFCWNSAKLRAPTPLAESRSLEYQFNALFQYVIKDRALRQFYQERRDRLGQEGSGDECCADCAAGGQCAVRKKRKFTHGGY